MLSGCVSDVSSVVTSKSTVRSNFTLQLRKVTKDLVVRGLECIGYARDLVYKYVEPETERSSLFTAFWRRREDSHLWWDLDSQLWNREYRPPALKDIVEHLERFGGSRTFDGKTFTRILPSVLRRIAKYEGGGDAVVFRDWLSTDNLRSVKVPANTSSGIRWKKLQLPKKKNALLAAAQEAAVDIRGLIEGIGYDTPPCFVAGRGKLVDADKETGKKEGRLIVVPDLKRHLLGSMASVPYSTLVKGLDKRNGGVMIGMGPFHGNYEHLAACISEHNPKYFLCVDFSGYDQTVPAEVIRASLTRISRRFEYCPGSVEYWDSEYEHLVNTKIVLPNGQVYVKRRGVASGDPWTSQVGSDANWIMEECVFTYLGWDARAWTFGDDVIIAVIDGPEDRNEALRSYSSAMRSIFGLEVKESDSYVTDRLVVNGRAPVEGESVKFLSNYFMWRETRVRPVPTFESVVERMMYPEHNDFDLIKFPTEFDVAENFAYEKGRVACMMMISWYNEMANDMLMLYYKWLTDRDPAGTQLPIDTWNDLLTKWDIDPSLGPMILRGGLPLESDVFEAYEYSGSPPLISWLLSTRRIRTGVGDADWETSLAGQ